MDNETDNLHLCDDARIRVDGWDSKEGHNAPCRIEKINNRWWLHAVDWYTIEIKNCPWCGSGLDVDKSFEFKSEPLPDDKQVEDLLTKLDEMLEEAV